MSTIKQAMYAMVHVTDRRYLIVKHLGKNRYVSYAECRHELRAEALLKSLNSINSEKVDA